MDPSLAAVVAHDDKEGDARALAIAGGFVLLLAFLSFYVRHSAPTTVSPATIPPASPSVAAVVDAPVPAAVEAAMMELARYDGAASTTLPTGEARARLQQAIDILARDRSFGAQVRRQWASALLPKAWQPLAAFGGPEGESSGVLAMPLTFSDPPTGLECCASNFECKIYEDPARRGATVRFGMRIRRPYLDVAAVLDPYSWKNVDDAFAGSEYLETTSCPTTVPPDLAAASAPPSGFERDHAFHERFRTELPGGSPRPFVEFENILHIQAHHDAGGLMYSMKYGLCPGAAGSLKASLPTANGQATGKLILDDGYATVLDSNGHAGDAKERSTYFACKTLAVTGELHDEVERRLGDVDRGLPLSLKVFAVQTRIAVCQGMTEVVAGLSCSAPVGCAPAKPDAGKTYDQMCSGS